MRQKKSILQTAKEHVEKTIRKEHSRGDSERIKNQEEGGEGESVMGRGFKKDTEGWFILITKYHRDERHI